MNFWDIGVLLTTKDQVIISSHIDQQRNKGLRCLIFCAFIGSALVKKSKGFFLFLDFSRIWWSYLTYDRGYFKNVYNNGCNDICNSN